MDRARMFKVQKGIFVCLFFTFMLSACSSNKKNTSNSILLEQNQEDIELNPFADQKVVINLNELYFTQSSFKDLNQEILLQGDFYAHVNNIDIEVVIPKNTPLAVLIDNSCLEELGSLSSITNKINGSALVNETLQSYEVEFNRDLSLEELEDIAASDPCVQALSEQKTLTSQNYEFNDTYLDRMDHLENIEAFSAYDIFTSASIGNENQVIVAVVDSGVDYNHPDLRNQMWRNARGNVGYDFIDNDNSPMDQIGHGTHVAGIIAAEGNNSTGIVGVAFENTKIMAVRVLGSDGQSTASSVVSGIYYAIENNADVINLSLGSNSQTPQELQAIRTAISAGIIVVAAAGNDGMRLSGSSNMFPAGYASSLQGMISVGSIDARSGRKSGFSNFSPSYVEIAAPGSNSVRGGIGSTFPGDTYVYMEGTSMATPVVAGATALVISFLRSNELPSDPSEVESLLLSTSSKRSYLQSYVKNGNSLNLDGLARHLSQSVISNDGGFN